MAELTSAPEAPGPPTGKVQLSALAAVDPTTALRILDSSPDGLTAAEAARRLARSGRNEVSSESRSFWSIAVEQMRSGINILLAIAGILTIVTGDLVDGAIILTLSALNVGLTIFQEFRAELALDALRAMLPLNARVRRGGAEVQVPASELCRATSSACAAATWYPPTSDCSKPLDSRIGGLAHDELRDGGFAAHFSGHRARPAPAPSVAIADTAHPGAGQSSARHGSQRQRRRVVG